MRVLVLTAALLSLSAISASAASAATFYVDSRAADPAPGCQDERPGRGCRTVAEALEAARTVDGFQHFIQIAAGAHEESIVIPQDQPSAIFLEGRPDADVRLESSGHDPVVRVDSQQPVFIRNVHIDGRRLAHEGLAAVHLRGRGIALLSAVEVTSRPDARVPAIYIHRGGGQVSLSRVTAHGSGPAAAVGFIPEHIAESVIDAPANQGGPLNPVLLADSAFARATLIVRSTWVKRPGDDGIGLVLNNSPADIRSSLITGGSTALRAVATEADRVSVIAQNVTLDAGRSVQRDADLHSVEAVATRDGAEVAVALDSSVAVEQQAASASDGAAAEIRCTYTDAPDHAAGGVRCGRGDHGNTTTPPGQLFVAGSHVPRAGSAIVDSGNPAFDGPNVDLFSNRRPIDGNRDCEAVVDRGAIELNGHENTPPRNARITAPLVARAAQPVTLSATAQDSEDASNRLQVRWRLPNGERFGARIEHVFDQAGPNQPISAVVTDSGGCSAEAEATISILPASGPNQPEPPQPDPQDPNAPADPGGLAPGDPGNAPADPGGLAPGEPEPAAPADPAQPVQPAVPGQGPVGDPGQVAPADPGQVPANRPSPADTPANPGAGNRPALRFVAVRVQRGRRATRRTRAQGPLVTWRLSRAARVSLQVQRRTTGILRAGRCQPARRGTGRGRRCRRWVAVANLRTTALRTSGRKRSPRLTSSRHRVTLVARTADGAQAKVTRLVPRS